jgi:sterol desaturase/sphingolipid hydroxylase (fatty acid hydroxylase superfamily)
MNIDLDTGKLVVFICGLVVFALCESVWPARPWRGARLRRWGFHGAIAVLNTVVIRVLIFVPFLLWIVYVEEEGWGLSRYFGIVGWTEIILSLVVLDGFDYWWHRCNHRLRPLWRMHKAHHADPEMDVTTALRFHPGELVYSSVAKAVWVAVWGPTMVAWFLFEALVSLCAQFHHANLDLPDRLERGLAWFIVTPRFHASHHLVERRYGDANFSTILSIWDRMFGTYSQPADGAATRGINALGLPEARDLALSWRAWLDEPVSQRNLGLSALRAPKELGR